jgi:TonB-dependent receptor
MYAADTATIQDRDSLNDMEQIRVFGEWINSNGMFMDSLRSVEFGFSRVDQAFTDIRREKIYDATTSTAADLDDSILSPTTLENFMNGFNGLNLTDSDYYFAINHNDAIRAFTGIVGENLYAGDIDTNSRVTEVLDSFYLQFNFESDFMDRPLNTVFALRYEEATNSSVGLSPLPNQIIWDFPGFSYGTNGTVTVQNNEWDGMAVTDAGSALLTDVSDSTTQNLLLPALSMSWAMSEDEVVRFGLSQSVARPALRDLSSVYSLGVEARTIPTASVGNPQLEPMKSTNIDIAYENYYKEGSYFAVNVFHKELEDFIGTTQVMENVNGITDPSMSPNALKAKEQVDAFFALVTARNIECGVQDGWDYGDGCVKYGAGTPFAQTDVYWQQLLMYDTFFRGQQVMYAWYTWLYNISGGQINYTWGDCCFVDPTGSIYVGPYRAPFSYSGYGTPGVDGVDNDAPINGDWWVGVTIPGSAFPLVSSETDPLAMFRVTKPVNLKEGGVDGIEIALQHLFDNGYGVQFNATKVVGGDVEPDLNNLYQQDALPGLGDSGNFSVFFENESFTARLALNHRGETYVGEGNYYQPLYVEARTHVDVAISYRVDENLGFFFDAMNITDEPTRLFARHSEMLFLSQDHGPVYKAGFRYKF